MPDLFGGAPKVNGHRYDLFSGKQIDSFRWVVGVFKDDGAIQTIIRAHKCNLLTYFPLRYNQKGMPTPLWKNYLFVEFREYITIDLCRSTSHFIKVLSARDEDGISRPILLPRNAIQESLRLVTMGKFNEVEFKRRFYVKGSLVRVIEGSFTDRKVMLEIDVPPHMHCRTRVPVDINGIKAKIEIFKLAL
jgi:hypothetical protein